jgi:hypothetical protein
MKTEPGNGDADDVRFHCQYAMQEVRRMSEIQTASIEKLYAIVDERVGQLIDLLERRFDNPWNTVNRMIILLSIGLVGMLFFSYANQHGASAAEQAVKTIMGAK